MSILKNVFTKAGVPIPATAPVPTVIFSSVINTTRSFETRANVFKDNFRIHVSNLIGMKQQEFCAREHTLNYFNEKKTLLSELAPGRDLLFAMGHAVHDFVRNKWI